MRRFLIFRNLSQSAQAYTSPMSSYWIIRTSRPGQEDIWGYTNSPNTARIAGMLQKHFGDTKWAIMEGVYRTQGYDEQVKEQKEHDGPNVPLAASNDGWVNRRIAEAMYRDVQETRRG
jgi:hypothetical protein